MKTYKGYNYIPFHYKRGFTNTFNGYVMIPKEHPLYARVNKTKTVDFAGHTYEHKDYDAANGTIDAHGGFTFAEQITDADIKRGRWPQPFVPGLWLGWDYAHLGDCFWDHEAIAKDARMSLAGVGKHFFNEKHWTLEEVEADCKNVIEQLIN